MKKLKHIYGHHIQFCKIVQNCYKTNYKTFYFRDFSSYSKMVCCIWTRFLCHFQNGALHFCTLKTERVIKQNVNFNSFWLISSKMVLISQDYYHFGFKPSKPNPCWSIETIFGGTMLYSPQKLNFRQIAQFSISRDPSNGVSRRNSPFGA